MPAALARAVTALPWWAVLLACATLGLAPYVPEPHLWEKLRLLATNQPMRPIDLGDLALHAAPWGVSLLKLAASARRD